MTGAQLIAEERGRQVQSEGYNEDHDEQYGDGEPVRAAIAYASAHDATLASPPMWPWSWQAWKPKGRIRNLVRAGALIAAEIDRIQEAAANTAGAKYE